MRWSRPGLDAELRALCTSALGVHDAPANVSVIVGGRDGRTRTKHRVFAQGALVAVTASDSALVRSVMRAVSVVGSAPPPGALRIEAFLVMNRNGFVTAVDHRLGPALFDLLPRLGRTGERFLAMPGVDLLPERSIVRLPECSGALGVSVDQIDRMWPPGSGDDPLISGDVPLATLVYTGVQKPLSRAAAVADIVPIFRNSARMVRSVDIARLPALLESSTIEFASTLDQSGLLEILGDGSAS